MHCLGKVEIMIACNVMVFVFKDTLFLEATVSVGKRLVRHFSLSKQ